MVDTIKFSQMAAGGDLANNDKVPGLGNDGMGNTINVLYNNPWTFLPPGTTAERPAPSAAINYRLRFNTDEQLYEYYDAVLGAWTQLQESAFTAGPFIIYTADPSFPDAFNLASLASDGILKQTVSSGIATLNLAVNGVDFYGPGYTGYINAPAGFKDINGNITLDLQSNANGVNYFRLSNQPTGSHPTMYSEGADTDISFVIAPKGDAGVAIFTSAVSAGPFQIYSGTGMQHVTNFLFANTANNIGVTFQDSSGTVAYLSNIPSVIPSALTEVNDTNVTLTLGGSPTVALLAATSITAGWTGQLSIGRGGTGVSSVTTAPTASAWAGWDANKNLSANNLIEGYATTVSAAGTTVLTVASAYQQFLTGSANQTYQMSVVSTLVLGQAWLFVNQSSGTLTVQSSGGNTIVTMAANTVCQITCISLTGTTAASWFSDYAFSGGSIASILGTTNQINVAIVGNVATLSTPQSIATSSAVQFASVQFSTNNGLLDANGNTLMNFSPVASAVNLITLSNAITGNTPIFSATGSDTNIALALQGKGNLGVQLKGMTSGGAAPTGYTGEIIRGDNTSGTAATTATPLNVTSISLTAGNWDLFGVVTFGFAGAASLILAGISTTSATTGATNTFSVWQGAASLANTNALVAPMQTVSISATTTYYLVGQGNFVSTATVFGNLIARRRI